VPGLGATSPSTKEVDAEFSITAISSEPSLSGQVGVGLVAERTTL
jgi:hypothetical protein